MRMIDYYDRHGNLSPSRRSAPRPQVNQVVRNAPGSEIPGSHYVNELLVRPSPASFRRLKAHRRRSQRAIDHRTSRRPAAQPPSPPRAQEALPAAGSGSFRLAVPGRRRRLGRDAQGVFALARRSPGNGALPAHQCAGAPSGRAGRDPMVQGRLSGVHARRIPAGGGRHVRPGAEPADRARCRSPGNALLCDICGTFRPVDFSRGLCRPASDRRSPHPRAKLPAGPKRARPHRRVEATDAGELPGTLPRPSAEPNPAKI